ncbi:terpene synthase [Streptomyces sp. NPDC001513]|uniref:terpene synthase family protein n=1 Tax=Streptomyces sp. NPDC001513 TaxID=3364580 RepID=UPI0036A8C265
MSEHSPLQAHSPLPMPKFLHLFHHRTSPLAQPVEEHAQAWLHHYRLPEDPALRERVARTCLGTTTASVYPGAGQEVLELGADLIIWLTAFDDTHVEAPGSTAAHLTEQLAVFAGILEQGGPTTGTGFASALADLVRRMHTALTPGQRARLTSSFYTAFLGWNWELSLHGRPVGLDEYNAMRPHTVYGSIVTTLIEPGAGLDLPDGVRDTPDIRQLNRTASLLSGWINDLYSFTYEQGTQSPPPSLPTVLAHQHHLPLPEAFATAVRMFDDKAGEMHQKITQLRTSPTPGVAAYATACAEFVASNKLFYGVTRRYTAAQPQPSHLQHAKRAGGVTSRS